MFEMLKPKTAKLGLVAILIGAAKLKWPEYVTWMPFEPGTLFMIGAYSIAGRDTARQFMDMMKEAKGVSNG